MLYDTTYEVLLRSKGHKAKLITISLIIIQLAYLLLKK